MGNVLPLVIASPFLVKALLAFAEFGPSVAAIVWAAVFPVAAWIAVGLFGLVGNGAMRHEIGRRLHQERPFEQTEKVFVGIASPTFRSALDPHEDVGYLLIYPDRAEFFGGGRRFIIYRRDVVKVRVVPNTHTVLGLGRWIAIEAVVSGLPARLLIEPREKKTLFGNLVYSKKLLLRLKGWHEKDPRTFVQGSQEASNES